MSDREMVSARLELVAAKAKVLAADYKAGRFWSREDAVQAIGELQEQISLARQEVVKP